MCHKPLGPRCPTCHKPSPRHRCHCPAKHTSAPNDGLPTYAAATAPAPPPSHPLPLTTQPRCGRQAYGGCGYRGRRQCRGGPIRLLIGLVVRKVQERKEAQGRLAGEIGDEREREGQERGVVETVMDEEKRGGRKGDMNAEEEEKDAGVEILTKSVRSLSV